MTDILPTYTCFDDALELVNNLVIETPKRAFNRSITLVHGIARGTDDGLYSGEPYAHAWVEDNRGLCWDCGVINGQRVYYAVKRAEFYEARRIQETTRYTVRQAALENLRTRHYGPWKAKYAALCGPRQRIMGSIAATVDPEAAGPQ